MNRTTVQTALALLIVVMFLVVTMTPAVAQGEADLSITGITDRDKAKVYQEVEYTVTVTNLGPEVATGVHFFINLPDQFTPVSTNCLQSSPLFEACVVGDLAPGQSSSAVFVVRVCCLPKGENRFTGVSAFAVGDNDPDLDNNITYSAVRIIGGWNMKP